MDWPCFFFFVCFVALCSPPLAVRTDWLPSLTFHMSDENADSWLIPLPHVISWCHVSSPHTPAFIVSHSRSLAPFICHITLISLSLMCPPPHSLPSPRLSISGVQFCRPRRAGFSCGNERGHPEGGSAHRFWDPAAGGCLCHWNPVRTPSHPLYWARQPSWEVTRWDTQQVNTHHIGSHIELHGSFRHMWRGGMLNLAWCSGAYSSWRQAH